MGKYDPHIAHFDKEQTQQFFIDSLGKSLLEVILSEQSYLHAKQLLCELSSILSPDTPNV